MKIGEVLSGWRYSKRMGVREAAVLLGISHSTLSRIENGKPMDADTQWRIMEFLFGGDKATWPKKDGCSLLR